VKAGYEQAMRLWFVIALTSSVLACQAKSDRGSQEAATKAPAKSDTATKPAAATKSAAAPGGASNDAYVRDMDAICNCEEKSGALDLEEAARGFHIAQWLGQNVRSQKGRDFLAELASRGPQEKVKLLSRESSKLGMHACALATTWNGGKPTTL